MSEALLRTGRQDTIIRFCVSSRFVELFRVVLPTLNSPFLVLCSPPGSGHSQPGAVHLTFRRLVSVCTGHRLPRHHRNIHFLVQYQQHQQFLQHASSEHLPRNLQPPWSRSGHIHQSFRYHPHLLLIDASTTS